MLRNKPAEPETSFAAMIRARGRQSPYGPDLLQKADRTGREENAFSPAMRNGEKQPRTLERVDELVVCRSICRQKPESETCRRVRVALFGKIKSAVFGNHDRRAVKVEEQPDWVNKSKIRLGMRLQVQPHLGQAGWYGR